MTEAVKSRSKYLYKVMIGALKVLPMLLAFFTIINTSLDFFGIESTGLSFLAGVSVIPMAFLYIASYVFQFCVYHRMFLHYVVVNNLLTYTDYYIGLPISNSALFMLHLLVLGIFLFLILYFHQKEVCCRR